MKKIISIVLTLFIICTFSYNVFAEVTIDGNDGVTINGEYFQTDPNGASITITDDSGAKRSLKFANPSEVRAALNANNQQNKSTGGSSLSAGGREVVNDIKERTNEIGNVMKEFEVSPKKGMNILNNIGEGGLFTEIVSSILSILILLIWVGFIIFEVVNAAFVTLPPFRARAFDDAGKRKQGDDATVWSKLASKSAEKAILSESEDTGRDPIFVYAEAEAKRLIALAILTVGVVGGLAFRVISVF